MNGADIYPRGAPRAMPTSCPFCNGEAAPISVDGPLGAGQRIFGVECRVCGVRGSPAATEEEAIAWWNRRSQADPASLATKDTPLDTCALAASLVELARALYSGGIPPSNQAVVIMVVPGLQPTLGLSLHKILPEGASMMCATAAQLLAQKPEQKTPSGIIVPGRM